MLKGLSNKKSLINSNQSVIRLLIHNSTFNKDKNFLNSSSKRKLIISRKIHFSCGVPSKQSPYGSGSNYTVEVFIEGKKEETGLVVPLSEVDKALKALVSKFNHRHLKFEIFSQKKKFSSTELAIDCYKELKKKLSFEKAFVKKMCLYEGSYSWIELS